MNKESKRLEWNKQQTKLLIATRIELEREFNFGKFRKAVLWGKVLSRMKEIDKDFTFSKEEMIRKFRNLMITYNRIKTRNKESGRDAATYWEYFKMFDEAYGSRHAINSPTQNIEPSNAVQIKSKFKSLLEHKKAILELQMKHVKEQQRNLEHNIKIREEEEASKAKKRSCTPSSTSEYSGSKRSSATPMNVDSSTTQHVETQNENGNRLVERLVRKKKKQNVRSMNLRKDVSTAIKMAENLLQNSVKTNEVMRPATPYDWVGQLVTAQLGYMEDSVIRNDTIWTIQCVLRKGIERQQAKNEQGNDRNEPINKADNDLLRTEDMDSQSDQSLPDSSMSFAVDILGTNIPLKEE